MFESSTHPQYSPARAVSSINYLDNVIHHLQLTVIDNNDPDVSFFKPHHLPSVKPRSGSGLKYLSEVFLHSAASECQPAIRSLLVHLVVRSSVGFFLEFE